MSILERVAAVETKTAELEKTAGRQEEQIDGAGGLVKAMEGLSEEVRAMKRAMWTVGGGIMLSAIGFAFTVLGQMH